MSNSDEMADRLEHWAEFFTGADYEELTVADDLLAAAALLRGQAAADENAAQWKAVAEHVRHSVVCRRMTDGPVVLRECTCGLDEARARATQADAELATFRAQGSS